MGRGANQLSPYKAKLAMAVRSKNVHWALRDIERRHWLSVGQAHGVVSPDGQSTAAVLDDLVARTPDVVRAVKAKLPKTFPQSVSDLIFEGLFLAADRLTGC